MWKTFVNSEAAQKMAEALEKTGDVITKGAENIAKPKGDASPKFSVDGGAPTKSLADQQTELTKKLKTGWGSMVEATQKAVQTTKEKLEQEQNRLASRLRSDRPYRRDPSQPLDVDALRDAEVVYITDRIVIMSHPAMQSTVDGDITPNRKLAAVQHLLQKRHNEKYMIWNLSEVDYDTSILDDQVLTFSFPGSPSPPLGLWLKLLVSMESWLKADQSNVAVVHCLTGKGRSSTVVAAFLCWVGEAGFSDDIYGALDYIARCKHLGSKEDLTIPSQRRYSQYFSNMLDGVRPAQPPLLLKRIIMSEAPKFAKGPPRPDHPVDLNDSTNDMQPYDPDEAAMGCAPYLQIFKGGQLLFTTAAHQHHDQGADELPFCAIADGAVAFHVETILQGDVLIRCRHLTAAGQRISMFRAAFHTGYVPPSVMRLSKSQLDGACTDKRFPENFFLDLIFEACDAEMASKHLSVVEAEAEKDDESNQNEAEERRKLGTKPGSPQKPPKTATVTASAYDSMLHRDSRFWDVIAARREAKASTTAPAEPDEDDLWGPTIGRRRNFKSDTVVVKEENGATKKKTGASAPMDSFSIGGDFDFMMMMNQEQAKEEEDKPKPKDELMEALMGALGESPSEKKSAEADTEEILFEDEDAALAASLGLAPSVKEPEPTIVTLPPPPSKSEDATPAKPEAEKKEEETKTDAAALEEATNLLGDADLDTDDMDALLDTDADAADLGDANLDDFDFDDDEELEDLENFLKS